MQQGTCCGFKAGSHAKIPQQESGSTTALRANYQNDPTMARCVPGFDVSDPPPPPSKPTRAVKPKPDDASVVLRGVVVPLNSDVGMAFTVDCCRNREKIFCDARLQEKYSIDPNDWNDILNNKALRLAISAECDRRMLNGTAAQESAAKIFTESPEAMGSIL